MNYKSFLYLIVFLCLSNTFGQSTILGTVKDKSSKTPIQSANLRLFNDEDKLVGYTFTDEDGFFNLQNQSNIGRFLKITSLGYSEEVIIIENEGENSALNILLTPKSFDLEEVIVETERPVRVKKDTIIFNANNFAQGNEDVVEDLLKKIPGLSIDSDGTIKVGNKEIEKVMVDGDDFFESGYKILTKNMPARPIDKIEVYQNYSNNRLLKGVEESDRVALNLSLQDDAKRIWFGNLELGYGLFSENRYEVRGNLMNFGKKNKYYFLTNLNNTGYDATGDINQLIRPSQINEPASIGDDQQISTFINLESNPPNFKRRRTNFNNSELLSLNAIFNPSEKLKIKTLGFFNSDENYFFRNTIQNFEANQTNFTNTEDYNLLNKKQSGFGKINLVYDISRTSSFEAISKYSKGSIKGDSNLIFNGSSTLQSLNSNNELFDQKISYTNKFEENRVFLLTGRFIKEETPENYRINRFFYDGLFPDQQGANNVAQGIESMMQFAGFEAHLFNRKENGDLLELRFGDQYRNDNLNSAFALLKDEDILESSAEFQNRIQYVTNNLYLKSKYQWEIVSDFSLIGKLDFHQLYNELHSNRFFDKENLFIINSSLELDWKINSKNRLKSSYSNNINNSGVRDIYNSFILTDFRSFQSGTGSFNQLEASSILLSYELGQWSDRFFANTFFTYSKNHDFFSSRSIIEQNYSLSEKILLKDRESLSFNTKIDRYFKIIRSNLKLDLGYSQSNYKNVVNNSAEREINFLNYSYGVELRSGFTGIFNYHIGTKWNASKIETAEFLNSFTNNLSFIDLVFFFTDRVDFQINSERYYFGNLQRDNIFYFLDVEGTYLLQKKKFTLSLEARNLFNTKKFQNFTVSDIGTSTTSYRLLPRFALLKLKYRF